MLPNYTPNMCDGDFTREQLIVYYFHQNYSYKEIVQVLHLLHGISLSHRHLKTLLKRMNLRQRPPLTEALLQRALDTISDELKEHGQCVGHKVMWKRLLTKGVHVPREVVRCALRILDKDGVEQRKKRVLKRRRYINPGPNFAWHIDGYDKLKPFGFAIHGAIDGYSRKILWLNVGITNNDPTVIALYYVKAILKYKCVPCLLRSEQKMFM